MQTELHKVEKMGQKQVLEISGCKDTKKNADCKQNGRNNATEMQIRRDRIPNQRTKPASNAGLMDGG